MPDLACFTIELPSRADASATMAAVLDLDAHQRLIPLTTLKWIPPLRPGSRFIARTGLGPVAVDDVMQLIEYATPTATTPGHARIHKTGRVIVGDIQITVTPTSRGSRVVWIQHIGVRGVPRALNRLTAGIARFAYRTILNKLIATVG